MALVCALVGHGLDIFVCKVLQGEYNMQVNIFVLKDVSPLN